MFSREDFIEASRNFVCCRIESYESKAAQDLVRSFLDGRFENTAFCILDPSGQKRLSGTGRSPAQGLAEGRGPGRSADEDSVVRKLKTIAADFPPQGESRDAVVQDFHSFRQALNVASGDQRLLLFVAAGGAERENARRVLKPVMVDRDILGKFHVDLANGSTDAKWAEAIAGVNGPTGFVIIRADEFGMKGTALAHLPIAAGADQIKASLLSANERFAQLEDRKVYSDHVAEGRREGIYFESGMPYGEDRDGDGKIDQAGGKGRGKGKGPR